jgi:hypothetical protein
MPGRSANLKNEKRYEALSGNGTSKERAAKIAQLLRLVQPRRQERRQPDRAFYLQAVRNNGPQEGGGPQGRQGSSPQVLTSGGVAGDERRFDCG